MLKQLLLVALGILSLFFAFIWFAYQFQEVPITDKLYVNKGICPKNWKNCIDTKNFQFQNQLLQLDKNQALKEINEWLTKMNKIRTPFKVILNSNNQYVAEAKQSITPMTKLCSFTINDMFHRDALGPAYFTKSYPEQKLKQDIASFLKLIFPQQMSKLMIIFLYHIYNYEYSKYKPWIQTFPENVNSLISELTYYEMQLLSNDQSYGFIEKYIDIVQREFKTLEVELKKKLTKEDFASFFNNKQFTLADYIYARNIVQITGQGSDSKIIQNLQQIKGAIHEILLNPCNLYIGKKVLDSEIPIETQQQNFDSEEQAQFDKVADREFQIGEEIMENFHYPFSYSSFVLHGQVPKGSKTDCVELQFYEYAELTKKNLPKITLLNFIAENGFACIGCNEIGISRIQFTGKVMNMQQQDIKKCYKAFKEAEQRVDQQFYVLKEVCANPDWNKFDPRIVPLASIKENLKKIQQQLNKAQEYYELRKAKKKPYLNAQLIYEYFLEKKNIILNLKEKISQLQPFQNSLPNQNKSVNENEQKNEL